MASARSSFAEVLHSDGPAPYLAEKLKLYAFLIGRWDTNLIAHAEDGATHKSRGEIHAGWVLEGRALQDVWMTPPRSERDAAKPAPPLPVIGAWYGTTLRIYDPKLDAWHILWNDPATGVLTRQVGRAEGADIVQTGSVAPGVKLRWRFTKITSASFHWLGEISNHDGKTWRLQAEVLARRAA